MDLTPADYQILNKDGRGFQIKGGTVTVFNYRKIFLKNSQDFKTHENSLAPATGSCKSADVKPSSSSASGNKRKFGNDEENDEEFINRKTSEDCAKKIRNKSTDGNDTSEEGEISMEELLFSNDLILQIIFANLKVADLKSCRQVTRLWNLEATKILLKRDCLASIQISDSIVKFQDAIVYKHPVPFQDFQAVIENSKLFPCKSFVVQGAPLSKKITNFFHQHGHLVKSFWFEARYFERTESRTTAYDILLLAAAYFPNLQNLKFTGDLEAHSSPVMEIAIDIAPEMKNLEILELGVALPVDILAIIARKAFKLKSIYFLEEFYDDYDLGIDNILKVGNLVPLLKSIDLVIFLKTLPIYQGLLKHKLQLSKIDAIEPCLSDYHTPLDQSKMGRFFSAMLQKCSETVTHISHLRCLGHVPELNIPVFPKVKRLGIDTFSYSSPFLPSETDLAEIFPNVTSIEFDIWNACNNTSLKPEEILAEVVKSPMFSVRHVSMIWGKTCVPDIYVERLCALLPNVNSATFPVLSESSYQHIWKLGALQELRLEMETKTKMDPFLTLDSAFTGFSVETVKNLFDKDQADLNLSTEEVAALRIKPSIVDLKYLRKLSLFFRNDTDVGHDGGERNAEVIFDPGDSKALLQVNRRTFLSYISRRFGFDLCPMLQSSVCVRFKHITKIGI